MTKTVEMGTERASQADDLDLPALGAAIRRKKAWIVIPTLVALAAAAAFVTLVKPRYTADAQVLLENQESFLTRPERTEGAREQASGPDPESVASQVQLVTSRDLARRAITELNLVGNPEFDPLAHGLGVISQVLVLTGLMRDPTRTPPEDRVLEAYLERLTVYSPPKTRVLVIEFRSNDPELAARAANEIATLYLETQSDAKRNAAKTAATSLAAEVADLRLKLAHTEADVETFRASSGLLAGTNNMTSAGQQLAELNTELSKARTSQADAQAKASLIRDMLKQGQISDVADVANNDLVRRISEQRVTAKSQLALESRTLLPGHPRIKELVAQVADLDGELRAAGEKTARGLENMARVAAARVANLEAAIDQQKKSVNTANSDDVHLRELERAAQGYRDQLQSSMAKYQEASGRENSPATPADARIIARAAVPQEPSYPKKVPTLVFAGIAGFVLSLGGVVAGELLGGRRGAPAAPAPMPATKDARGNSDEEAAEAPVTGTPAAAVGDDEKDDSQTGEAEKSETEKDEQAPQRRSFGRRRTLPPRDAGKGLRVVATALAEDGATNQRLIDFARELARNGRAIIVDFDPSSTKSATLLGERPHSGLGLTDIAAGSASFGDVIHRDHVSRLHFVPFGSSPSFTPADLDLILDALMQTYDFLLIAAPPLEKTPMAKELAAHADFVALAASPKTSEAQLQKISDELYEAGAAEVVLLEAEPAASMPAKAPKAPSVALV